MTARLLFAVFLISRAVSLNAQTQVMINASKDNTLVEDSTGSLSNGIGPYFFAGRVGLQANGLIRRGLLAFDVAGTIPSGATIQSVTLTLNMSQTSSGAQTVGLYRAVADWGEGTSNAGGGGGAPATPGDATWLHAFFDSVFWSNVGGDFSTAPSASQSVTGIGSYTWGSTPEMVSDVQQWLDNPSTNFGWVIVGNEDTVQTVKRFDSRDNVSPAVRPRLDVTYQPVVSVGEKQVMPLAFALHQNYPNPFNPSTTLSFSIPYSSFVILSVYNLLGQEVATMVNEVKQPGRYDVAWDAGGHVSGVYFYALTASNIRQTKKLILIK